jgi:hypothetical protein
MAHPHAFDANWLSVHMECAEASMRRRRHLRRHAPRPARPYAGRPATAGRAVCNDGAIDRALGGRAALLGRHDDAARHLQDAIRINDELGCTVWREQSEQDLERLCRSTGDPASTRNVRST